MMADLRKSRWKGAIAALYAAMALLLGFAHIHASAPTSAFPSLVAQALPDGAPVAICGAGSEYPGAPAHAQPVCDACLLTAAPGALASPPEVCAPLGRSARMASVVRLSSAAKTFALAPQSRGPPQV